MLVSLVVAVVAAAILAVLLIASRRRSAEQLAESGKRESSLKSELASAREVESKLRTDASAAAAWSSSLESTIGRLEAEVARLRKWEVVADADAKAAELIREANELVARLRAQADEDVAAARVAGDRFRADAEAEARAIRSAARERADRQSGESDAALRAAKETADAIVSEANRKAAEVAGDALRALQQADEYERTVKALRNAIEGYGDRYIVPGHTLLDDLAEDVGHTEAGQRLKAVRSEIRERVRSGMAATCDYVEENRRETAVRFVTDAFNGKADSILARVKNDNAGTLAEEMRDAFTLVNHNGRAFRDARILDDYLSLRLEELRWAAISHELKLQEREEQRKIQEQIREEEKARREYERAIKDAAREEEMVRKAMAKAESQMAKASEEQKAKYELQLVELAQKLQEAEARNQRALSMAQQTKRGHVYIISNIGSLGENVYKIGVTRRLDPQERIRELGDSSVPFEFDVHALIFSDDAPGLENQLHRHFVMAQVNKVNYRKEFFRTELTHIRTEIEALGLTAKWTMAAAAQEYRETLAIERAIATDPAKREAWLKRQLTLDPVSEAPFDEEPGVRLPASGAGISLGSGAAVSA